MKLRTIIFQPLKERESDENKICQSFSIGFDKAAEYITGNRRCPDFACAPYDAIGWYTVAPCYIPSSDGKFDFIRNFYLEDALHAVEGGVGLVVSSVLGPIVGVVAAIVADPVLKNLVNRNADAAFKQENHAMVYALAAIGDSWVGPDLTEDIFGNPAFKFDPLQNPLFHNNTSQILSYVTQNTNTYIFALLNTALHGTNLNVDKLGDFNAGRVLSDISYAPSCGAQFGVGSPYNTTNTKNYNPDYNGFYGWYGHNRWIRSRQANCIDPTSDQGVFNGLDFMLLYNLYRLTFGGGSTNYTNFKSAADNNSYWPMSEGGYIDYDYPDIYPDGFYVPLFYGDNHTPVTITALNDITSNSTIGYQSYISGDPSNLGGVVDYANITYTAGKNIKLTNGFNVQNGATFVTKINGDLGCGDYVGGNGNTCPKTIARIASSGSDLINPVKGSIDLPANNPTLTTSGWNEISFYPNPASKNLTISYNLADENQQIHFVLTRLDGVELLNEQYNSNQKGQNQRELDISHLSSGLYFIRGSVSDKNFVFKFVKE